MEEKAAGISFKDACAQASARIAAMPVKQRVVTCPLCGEQFLGFSDLTAHYLAAHPDSVAPVEVRMTVNGRACQLIIEPQQTLKEVLQFSLGLTGAKQMCDRGQCGSCTVILDGKPTLSCNTLAADCDGKTVETVEGIAVNPRWQPLRQNRFPRLRPLSSRRGPRSLQLRPTRRHRCRCSGRRRQRLLLRLS